MIIAQMQLHATTLSPQQLFDPLAPVHVIKNIRSKWLCAGGVGKFGGVGIDDPTNQAHTLYRDLKF